MWVSVHAFTGLALGVWSPLGLGLTLVVALVLHLLLDLVPHWDYSSHGQRVVWASLDVGASALGLLVVALALDDGLSVVLVGLVSALPDLDVFDSLLSSAKRRRWFPSHWRRFPHGTSSPAVGIPLQLFLAVGSLVAVTLGG